MLSHTGTLWQYLGSFILYTLGAVALIYGAYWYARRSTGGFAAAKQKTESVVPLVVESSLSLEPQKTLYVIRSGQERFLIATAGEGTQLLSKLEPVEKEAPIAVPLTAIPMVEETPRLEPWYTPGVPNTPTGPQLALSSHRESFGSRFVKSVQWLVSSRMK